MSDTTRSGEQATSLGGQIDDICDRFEDAWRAGQRPALEQYLGAVSVDGRVALLRELLKLELYYRHRAGDQPTLDEYRPRFPDDVELLQEVFADGGIVVAAPPLVATGAMRYVAQRLHRRGGLGEVYVADDVGMGRPVALKRVQNRLADDAESRRRFLAEAAITGQLEHPGVVPVYGLVQDQNGEPCYAMRFIEGETFQDAARRFHGVGSRERQRPEDVNPPVADAPGSPDFSSLAFRNLLQRFVAVCNTIAYAHSRGVLHRDLKPANVMLGNYGETLVVDWGLARSAERDAAARSTGAAAATPTLPSGETDVGSEAGTRPGQVLGTPAYMSPEQARGESDQLGPATDIFGLGALLYVLLTGRAPYAGGGMLDLLDRAARGEFAPPRSVRGDVPPALEAVCRKAMALRPEDRYDSALALTADVERWLADEPVTAYAEPLAARVRRWVRRHARLVTAVGLTLLIGSAALGAVAWQRERALETTREQKRRTRVALDAMIAPEMIERLGTQDKLTAGQREFLQMALGYYREFAAEAATDEEGRKLVADAHYRVANFLAKLGDKADAEAACRSAEAAYERLAADYPAVPNYRKFRAACLHDRAYLLVELGKLPDAEAAYRDAIRQQRQLADEYPAVADYRRELAKSHTRLANLLVHGQKVSEAEPEYRASMTLHETLRAELPDDIVFRYELAYTRHCFGVMLATQGKFAAARDALASALAMRNRLAVESEDTHYYRCERAKSQRILGQVSEVLGKRPEAEEAYHAALAVFEELRAAYPGLKEYAIDAASTMVILGTFLREGDNATAAVEWHTKAIDRLAPVAAADPGLDLARHELTLAYVNRANDYLALKRYADALPDCERALERDTGRFRGTIRLFRAACLIHLGRAAEGVATAEEIAKEPAVTADTLYDCACIFALAAAGPSSDRLAVQAIATLRRAVAAGYRNVPRLLADADLDALRRRDDFAALLWELADWAAPTN